MTSDDRFDLERFVTAQAPVFETMFAELRAGRKRSHWMWFVFPQFGGLGRSSTAQFYGIGCIDEARAYLAHPVLGPRLALCTRIVLASEGPSLHAIFGSPDDMKFRSCVTLFSLARTIRTIHSVRLSTALLHGSTAGRGQPPAPTVHVRRRYSGRPSSSMRFSEATAMATSVVCRPLVRERSASPITRL
jgi:uncharacterized protein (DUF1810 family)